MLSSATPLVVVHKTWWWWHDSMRPATALAAEDHGACSFVSDTVSAVVVLHR
jgi:hypothetical protein